MEGEGPKAVSVPRDPERSHPKDQMNGKPQAYKDFAEWVQGYPQRCLDMADKEEATGNKAKAEHLRGLAKEVDLLKYVSDTNLRSMWGCDFYKKDQRSFSRPKKDSIYAALYYTYRQYAHGVGSSGEGDGAPAEDDLALEGMKGGDLKALQMKYGIDPRMVGTTTQQAREE